MIGKSDAGIMRAKENSFGHLALIAKRGTALNLAHSLTRNMGHNTVEMKKREPYIVEA
jgi:hypothetical protein